MRRRIASGGPGALLALVLALPGWAQTGFKGEIDLEGSYAASAAGSLDAALGFGNRRDADLRARLMWSGEIAPAWTLDFAYLAEARRGGDVALTRSLRALAPAFYVDPAQTALLRLSQVVEDRGQRHVAQRIDRLSFGYAGTHLVARIGRQALTWGSGLVFHPMDLFNPFAPNATFTSYKPGTDMIYGQWLFDSGADLQGVVVARRDPASGRVRTDRSSAALKWRGALGGEGQFGVDLLLARHYRADVLGAGVSGALGGASWTMEAIATRLPDGARPTSFLANMQYAWSWGGRNTNGFVEYFHNGFGAGGGATLATLPAPLIRRIARGELFTLSKNYLAAGITLQWSPLLTLRPSVIVNLDDQSTLLVGQAVYSLGQNSDLTAGFQWPQGRRGSEYGGLETAPASGIFAAPPRRAYLRLSWYF